MRIRRVWARSFGPLVDSTLDLADQMTVVHGGNESAKSSWHAAAYAALCGRRRGPGRSSLDAFLEPHRPWDRPEWVVGAEIVLDDGRRVEIRQDLRGRVDCAATDLDLGRDCSGEIMHDGMPDAARWLGLDRQSFLATACVAQTQVLTVLNQASGLQRLVQRAAATAGADDTAAAALERIDEFRREHVGGEAANARKPLRRALDGQRRAAERLTAARTAHAEYERRLAQTRELRARADAAQAEAVRIEAEARAQAQAREAAAQARARQREAAAQARARQLEAAAQAEARRVEAGVRAAALRSKLTAAIELDRRLGGVEPPSMAAEEETARLVAEALAAWSARIPVPAGVPVVAAPGGDRAGPWPESGAESGAEPAGWTAPSLPVGAGSATWAAPSPAAGGPADSAGGPADSAGGPAGTPAGGLAGTPVGELAAEELWALAAVLSGDGPAAGRGNGSGPGDGDGVIGHGDDDGGGVIGGGDDDGDGAIGGGAVDQRVEAARASVAGRRRVRSRRRIWRAAGLAVALLALAGAVFFRDRAAVALALAGLGAGGAVLAAVAAVLVGRSATGVAAATAELEVAQAEQAADRIARAAAQIARVAAQRRAEEVAAARAAAARRCAELGVPADAAALRALVVGRTEVVLRQRQERELRSRLEPLAARAEQLVLAAARAIGAAEPTAERAEVRLRQWQAARGEAAARLDGLRRDWTERQRLLDGRTVDELAAEVDRATAAANPDPQREPVFEPDPQVESAAGSEVGTEPVDMSTVDNAREGARLAAAAAAAAEGQLTERAVQLTPVGEAEEALSQADEELARVRELSETLELTKRFLEAAEERVHRDIAPVLADTVRTWLPEVTGGRYTDVAIDAHDLRVKVCGPSRQWRAAERLSHGTAEQIYLMLRIALASHLVDASLRCPLLLDDVTVHADQARLERVLDLLLRVSADRQVIVFSQQEPVRDWARRRLTGPGHAVVDLAPVLVT